MKSLLVALAGALVSCASVGIVEPAGSTIEAAPKAPAATQVSWEPVYRDAATAVGEARVVLLGEPSHEDGTAFAFKSGFVRYLHEHQGFNVLVWEEGLWACETYAGAMGPKMLDATRRNDCLGWPWVHADQAKEVIDYAAATRSTASPLWMTGLDINPTGSAAVARLEAWVLAHVVNHVSKELLATIVKAFGRFPKETRFRALTTEERRTDRSAFEELEAACSSFAPHDDGPLVRQTVRDIVRLYEWHEAVHADVSTTIDWNGHPELNNVRDAAMFENLKWLLDERYPRQKIIVWTANFHAAKRLAGLDSSGTTQPVNVFQNVVGFGERVAREPGLRSFAMAFTAYDGWAGNTPQTTWALGVADGDSIESAVSYGKSGAAFIDHVGLAKRRKARFIGYPERVGNWAAVFDGAVSFRTMKPVVQAP